MTLTPERLAAYADGELDDAEAHAVEAELERSPELRTQLATHLALKERLGQHFDAIVEQPVPEQLVRAVRSSSRSAEVIDLASARKQRKAPATASLWRWLAVPALAASIALAVVGPRLSPTPEYADRALARALDRQLVATQSADAPVRILLSFKDRSGRYCRGYLQESVGGFACRDESGWRIGKALTAPSSSSGEYRQASAPPAALMEAIQGRAVGPALDADEERRVRARGWRND